MDELYISFVLIKSNINPLLMPLAKPVTTLFKGSFVSKLYLHLYKQVAKNATNN